MCSREVRLTRNGRNGDRVKKKEEQKCCGVRASVLLTGGSSLLIRSLGRVKPADWPWQALDL